MTEREFITWLKGFASAANSYNITPAQWEVVKENLAKVHVDVPTLNYWKHTTNTMEVKKDDKTLLHD